jgi:uncharacterized delta-60 repeat protein
MHFRHIRSAVLLLVVGAVLISCSGGSSGGIGGSTSGNRSAPTSPSPGTLDMSFGTNGTVTTAFGTSIQAGAYTAVLQPDGKNIAAGYASTGTGTTNTGTTNVFALARYNKNGTLDTSFASTGTVTTAFGSTDDRILSVATQTNGKIVAVGYSNTGIANVFALVRYNPDGSLDTGFGTMGKMTTAFGTVDDEALAMTIQSDGKLLAAGYSNNGTADMFALVRYNSNGTLDTSFGTGGKVTNAFGTYRDRIEAIALQTNGKIVAAGHSDSTLVIARYNSDGSLDTSFGTGGIMKTVIGSYSYGSSCKIQPDGKLVVAGWSWNSGTNVFVLARYNADGSLDPSFGSGGVTTTAFGSTNAQAFDVAIQQDGKLVAAGWSITGTPSMGPYIFALARYNTNGTLDDNFGSGGMLTTAFSSFIDYACAVSVQADGKILATGLSRPDNTSSSFALVRYWP